MYLCVCVRTPFALLSMDWLAGPANTWCFKHSTTFYVARIINAYKKQNATVHTKTGKENPKWKTSSSKQLPHTEHFIMDFITSMLSPQLRANAMLLCFIMWCSGVGMCLCVFSDWIDTSEYNTCCVGLNYTRQQKPRDAHARAQALKWKYIRKQQQQPQVQQSKTK